MTLARLALALVLGTALVACQSTPSVPAPPAPVVQAPPGIAYEGSDGSSQAHAVIIRTELKTTAGVRSEYIWLAQRYPGYQRRVQALIHADGRHYDRLDITTADGRELSVWFDITSFFGKL